MRLRLFGASLRGVPLLVLTAVVVATAAGAAAGPRGLTVTQTTGSGGSDEFLNTSASGAALQGEVASSPNTSVHIPFAILGDYDPPGTTFGIGVAGISTTGYGVAAEAFGTQPTMLALGGGRGDGLDAYAAASGSGDAIFAQAQGSGDGVASFTQSGNAVYASSETGNGLLAFTQGGNYALIAQSDAQTPAGFAGAALLGLSTGESVFAYGFSGSRSHPAIAAVNDAQNTDVFGAYQDEGAGPVERYIVQGTTANGSHEAEPDGMDVQMSGDLYVYGEIYQNCSDYPEEDPNRCYSVNSTAPSIRTATGGTVRMFAPAASTRTVEDFGSGQLAGGAAYVRLDPAFAQTMSAGAPYLVFITPQGPCRNLYVTQKSTAGFAVREMDGRSDVAFDYRIVAKPFGDASVRLAAVAEKPRTGGRFVPSAAAIARRRATLHAQFASARVHPAPPSLGSVRSAASR